MEDLKTIIDKYLKNNDVDSAYMLLTMRSDEKDTDLWRRYYNNIVKKSQIFEASFFDASFVKYAEVSKIREILFDNAIVTNQIAVWKILFACRKHSKYMALSAGNLYDHIIPVLGSNISDFTINEIIGHLWGVWEAGVGTGPHTRCLNATNLTSIYICLARMVIKPELNIMSAASSGLLFLDKFLENYFKYSEIKSVISHPFEKLRLEIHLRKLLQAYRDVLQNVAKHHVSLILRTIIQRFTSKGVKLNVELTDVERFELLAEQLLIINDGSCCRITCRALPYDECYVQLLNTDGYKEFKALYHGNNIINISNTWSLKIR